MYILSPSLLSADFNILGQQLNEIKMAGAKYIHFDVMDGHFVPNISVGIPVIESIRKTTDLIIDVHLMIENPEKYVEAFANAGADIINFHIEATKNEATKNPFELIKQIRKTGKKVGVTIKPKTNVEEIKSLLPLIDMVLVMSVEPGFGGQKLIPETLEKIKDLRQIIKQNNLNVDIEIDGGVTLSNLEEVLDSGANVIVAGSSVFLGKDIVENVKSFIEVFNKR